MGNVIPGRSVTVEKDVRTFRRASAGSIFLSHLDQFWVRKGATIIVSHPLTMTYDHRDQQVVQILSYEGEFFAIVGELEQESR